MISQLVTLLIILPCIRKSQYCVCSRKVYKGDNEFGVTKFKVTAADQHKYVRRPVFCFVFFFGGVAPPNPAPPKDNDGVASTPKPPLLLPSRSVQSSESTSISTLLSQLYADVVRCDAQSNGNSGNVT